MTDGHVSTYSDFLAARNQQQQHQLQHQQHLPYEPLEYSLVCQAPPYTLGQGRSRSHHHQQQQQQQQHREHSQSRTHHHQQQQHHHHHHQTSSSPSSTIRSAHPHSHHLHSSRSQSPYSTAPPTSASASSSSANAVASSSMSSSRRVSNRPSLSDLSGGSPSISAESYQRDSRLGNGGSSGRPTSYDRRGNNHDYSKPNPSSSQQQQQHQPSNTNVNGPKPRKPPKVDPFAHLPLFDYRTFDPSSVPLVRYATTPEEAGDAIRLLSTGPLAFDIEWQPSYKKGEPENPTSLVQLGDGLHVVLIHLSLMNHVAPVELVTLMEDPNVLKLGVGIHGDASKLEKDLGIITRGCLDLNDIAWRKDPGMVQGLAKWTGLVLHTRLAKGKARMSNWSKPLTPSQSEYAVNDVHSTISIFHALRSRALATPPTMKSIWRLPLNRKGGDYGFFLDPQSTSANVDGKAEGQGGEEEEGEVERELLGGLVEDRMDVDVDRRMNEDDEFEVIDDGELKDGEIEVIKVVEAPRKDKSRRGNDDDDDEGCEGNGRRRDGSKEGKRRKKLAGKAKEPKEKGKGNVWAFSWEDLRVAE